MHAQFLDGFCGAKPKVHELAGLRQEAIAGLQSAAEFVATRFDKDTRANRVTIALSTFQLHCQVASGIGLIQHQAEARRGARPHQ